MKTILRIKFVKIFSAVILVACLLCIAQNVGAGTPVNELFISVETDKTVYVLGEDSLIAEVSATNTGPLVQVDLHMVIFPASLKQIYEWPDWNTALEAGYQNVTIPENLTLPNVRLFELNVQEDLPWAKFLEEDQSGLFFLGVALVKQGTIDFLSNFAITPFFLSKSKGELPDNLSVGFIGLAEEENLVVEPSRTDRASFGYFLKDFDAINIDACGNDAGLAGLESLERDTCQVVKCEQSFGPGKTFGLPFFNGTLNAGPQIDMLIDKDRDGGEEKSIVIPRDQEVFQMIDGESIYLKDDLIKTDYFDNAIYTFIGGRDFLQTVDIGRFNVSIRAPSRLGLRFAGSRTPDLRGNPTINRINNLQLEWNSGVVADDVWVRIFTSKLDSMTFLTTYYELQCRFTDDGAGTIPAEYLKQLPPTQDFADLFPGLDTELIRQYIGDDAFDLSGTELSGSRANFNFFPVRGVDYVIGTIQNGTRVPIVLE